MNLARSLLRGIFRSIARRLVMRAAGRAFAGRTTQFSTFRHPMEELLDKGLDLMELLELAAEIGQIIQQVRDAAAAEASNTVMMAYDDLNKGQKTLVDDIVLDYVDEYFQTTNEPDFDIFSSDLYSKHEALEQSLSDTASRAYAAGCAAGQQAFYDALVGILGEEALNRATDILAGRKSLFDMETSYAKMRQSWHDYSWIPDHVKASMFWRPIKNPKFWILPDHENAPFWIKADFTSHAIMTGQWSSQQAREYTRYLYEETADDPTRRTAPPGFKVPYSVDLTGTQWESQIDIPHDHFYGLIKPDLDGKYGYGMQYDDPNYVPSWNY